MAHFRELLKNKNFLLLWMGQVVSNFGDRLTQMALVALVYQKTPHSEMALAKLISFTIIPVFVIGPLAGAWVDRMNRKNVMIISDILRGFLVFFIPAFIIFNKMLPIYLIIFLVFSISRFFIPSKMAIIPDLVSRDKLLMANTLFDTTHMIGNVVGLVVAGLIVNIRAIGAIGGFYIDSSTFFISAALIAFIAHTKRVRDLNKDFIATKEAFSGSIRRSIFNEIKEGFGILTRFSDMRFVVVVYLVLLGAIGAVSCVIIVFIQKIFGTATRDLGFLGLFLVAGLLFGSVLYGRFGHGLNKRKMILLSFIVSGIALVLFTVLIARFPNIVVGGLLAALVGLAISPVAASSNTLAQEVVPQKTRGRIFSSLEVVIHLAFIIAMFASAEAAKFIDRFWILIITGMLISLAGLFGFLTSRQRA